jgi:hypothetical protein
VLYETTLEGLSREKHSRSLGLFINVFTKLLLIHILDGDIIDELKKPTLGNLV